MNALVKFEKSVHTALWGTESWEISAFASDPSRIRFDSLCPDFPLLFKVIDAKTRLSVQVHPNEETCKVTGGNPKTEMWCALSDGPVYAGLKPGTAAADVEAAVAAQVAEDAVLRLLADGAVRGEPACDAPPGEFLALYTARGEAVLDGRRVAEGTSILIPPGSTCEIFGENALVFQTRFRQKTRRLRVKKTW